MWVVSLTKFILSKSVWFEPKSFSIAHRSHSSEKIDDFRTSFSLQLARTLRLEFAIYVWLCPRYQTLNSLFFARSGSFVFLIALAAGFSCCGLFPYAVLLGHFLRGDMYYSCLNGVVDYGFSIMLRVIYQSKLHNGEEDKTGDCLPNL